MDLPWFISLRLFILRSPEPYTHSRRCISDRPSFYLLWGSHLRRHSLVSPSRRSIPNKYRAIRLTRIMLPPLNVVPTVSCRGIVEVRFLPHLSLLEREGYDADTYVLTHWFPYAVNCQANPNFEIFDAGGDGNAIQFCMNVRRAVNFTSSVVCLLTPSIGFVGYDPDLDTVIVAHQATNTSQPYVNQNFFLAVRCARCADILTPHTASRI